MHIYWGFGTIPECAPLPKKERKRIWRTVCWKPFYHWQTWVMLIAPGTFSAIGTELAEPFAWQTAGRYIGAGIGGLLYGQVATHMARPYIREQVEAEGLKGRE